MGFDGEIGCVGKAAFTSKQEAERIAGRRKHRCAYKCGVCRQWHVGTTRSREDRNREQRPGGGRKRRVW